MVTAMGGFVVVMWLLPVGIVLAAALLGRRGGRRGGEVAVERSAWLLLGLTGLAYQIGAAAVWAVVGYILAELSLFALVGRRLRRWTGGHSDRTVPAVLSSLAGGSRAVQGVAAAIVLVFMVVFVAAQVRAGSETLAASVLPGGGLVIGAGWARLELDALAAGALCTGAVILAYSVAGGLGAAAWSDAVRAVLILGALVTVPLVAALRLPGSVTETLAMLSPRLVDPGSLSAGAAVGLLGIGLGSPGNPHILERYLAARDEGQLARAALVGTLWNVAMAWGALWIGLFGRAWFPGTLDLPGGRTESVYPALAQAHLPGWLFGLVVASIFAGILSAADSQLLVAASAVIRDLGQRVLGRLEAADPARLARLSRWVVIALLALSTLLGLALHELVFTLVLFAWGGLGASLGPPLLLALYWGRTTVAGLIGGMVAGTAVTVGWRFAGAHRLVLEIVPAFAASLLVTWLLSLATRRGGPDERASGPAAEDHELRA